MSAQLIDPAAINLSADPRVSALRPALASKSLIIKTHDDYECAADVLMNIQSALATIEEARTRITVPLNASLKEVNGQAKRAAAPYLADREIIKDAMIAYDDAQERLREAEQRKANEIAERERQRLQAIAEAAAEKAEAAAQLLRDKAHAAAQAGREAQAAKLNARAEAAAEKAEAEAEEYAERASQVVAVISDRSAPKVGGIAVPKIWDFQITDEAQIPRDYLAVDEVKIRKVVMALKGLCKIPGVKVFERKRISAGRA